MVRWNTVDGVRWSCDGRAMVVWWSHERQCLMIVFGFWKQALFTLQNMKHNCSFYYVKSPDLNIYPLVKWLNSHWYSIHLLVGSTPQTVHQVWNMTAPKCVPRIRRSLCETCKRPQPSINEWMITGCFILFLWSAIKQLIPRCHKRLGNTLYDFGITGLTSVKSPNPRNSF